VDPVTHGFLGAAVAQGVSPEGARRRMVFLGAAAGMLADADLFFQPFTDPALPWEYHRHFTHALLFAPIGGLVAALPFLLLPVFGRRLSSTLTAAVAAYATHGLLDACTSWGTRLFLPFSSERVSWDVIGIIDPVFTLVLAAGVALGWLFDGTWRRIRVPWPALASLLLCAAYLGLGARQHAVALREIERTSAERGQVISHARAMPAPGSLLLWRGLYLASGRIYAEGGRVPLSGAPRFRDGGSVEAFVPESDARGTRVGVVETRFVRFADGFAARDPEHPDVVADMRFSADLSSFAPLWGIRLNASGGGDPVYWVELPADARAVLRRLWKELQGD
jgi:inner membrane protein